MRGIVSEVSATFVASTIRFLFPGWKTRCWSPIPSRANSGSISVFRKCLPSNRSAHSLISRSPGRNTSTSPSGSMSFKYSTPRPTCAASSSSSLPGKKNSETGNIRPGASITGTRSCRVLLQAVESASRRFPSSEKKSAKAPASKVAEEITTRISGLLASNLFRYPSRKSIFSDLSCASSSINAS